MKNFIILISLFLVSLAATAQNLLFNGDFEQGMITWFGDGFNVQTSGNNSFNFVDVEIAGQPSDISLRQGVNIIEGESYILTFNVVSDGNRDINVGIGLNEPPFNSAGEIIALSTQLQQVSIVITAENFGSPNSIVFFDLGSFRISI